MKMVHMKRTMKIVGPSSLEATVPLCNPRKWHLVASYNWSSVTCKKCLAKKKASELRKGATLTPENGGENEVL